MRGALRAHYGSISGTIGRNSGSLVPLALRDTLHKEPRHMACYQKLGQVIPVAKSFRDNEF